MVNYRTRGPQSHDQNIEVRYRKLGSEIVDEKKTCLVNLDLLQPFPVKSGVIKVLHFSGFMKRWILHQDRIVEK